MDFGVYLVNTGSEPGRLLKVHTKQLLFVSLFLHAAYQVIIITAIFQLKALFNVAKVGTLLKCWFLSKQYIFPLPFAIKRSSLNY